MIESLIEKLLSDGACVSCAESSDGPICRECRTRFKCPDGCRRCGSPLCDGRGCERTWLPYRSLRAAVVFEGPARALVLAMKRSGGPGTFRLAASEMAERLALEQRPALDGSGTVVTWVPAGPGRRERGFDQGRELAHAVADEIGASVASTLLRIGRERQHDLDLSGRLAANSYRARRSRLTDVRRMLLVDDVSTSGATLFYASLALREHGARAVDAVAFARTPRIVRQVPASGTR